MGDERVRMNPVQYTEVSSAVLAALVIEWSVLRDEALEDQATEPTVRADLAMNLAEAAQAWSRRRGLGGATVQASMDDAATYLVEHDGLTEVQKHLVASWMHRICAHSERTAALLTKLGRGH